MRNARTMVVLSIASLALAIVLWLVSRPTPVVPTMPVTEHRSPTESMNVLETLPPPAGAARTAQREELPPERRVADEPEVGELLISGEKYVTRTTKARRQLFFPTGELYAESPLSDGKQSGTCKCWYKNGQLHAEEQYVDGTREGQSTYYSESGARIAEGSYFHGYMDGTWVTWYENGLKESEGFYDTKRRWDAGVHAQEKSGYWAFWKPDGSIDAERSGIYDQDKLVSR